MNRIMTDDEIRIEIAESVAWEWWQFKDATGVEFYQIVKPPAKWPKRQNGIKCKQPLVLEGHANDVPAYTEDLNAMHEVEETMDGDIEDANSPRYIYAGWLYRIVPKERQPIRATARQRAEAYLRTIGRWRE